MGGYQVKRHVKGRKKRVDLDAPLVHKDYMKHFNAVDRNDRDSSDYTCSIRTHRWYLRILFWLLDRVVFSCYILVCEMQKEGNWKHEHKWKNVNNKNGRRNFQIDLGIALIAYGIETDWTDRSMPKPKWMRTKEPKPCECEKCFFCKSGETKGMFNEKTTVITTSSKTGKKRKKKRSCTSERMTLSDYTNGGRYCQQCYDEQPSALTVAQKKNRCRKSRCGCPSCNEPICKECWKRGYNNPHHMP